jgi:hypothetical protein
MGRYADMQQCKMLYYEEKLTSRKFSSEKLMRRKGKKGGF